MAQTLNQTFVVTNCSFSLTDIILFTEEILWIIYFHPPPPASAERIVCAVTDGPAQPGHRQRGRPFSNNLTNINTIKVRVGDLEMS